jgi:hypothetical protein
MAYKYYQSYLPVTTSPSIGLKEDLQAVSNEQFEVSPTFKTVKHNGINVEVRVVGVYTKESTRKRIESIQKIIFQNTDYIVKIGDIFEFDNAIWLCTDVGGTPATKSCSVQTAYNSFTFYKSNISPTPITVPYVNYINNITSSNMGVDENKYIIVPDGTLLVLVSNNSTTRHIERNDVYRMYDKDGMVDNYTVIDIDRIKLPGLIILRLSWTAVQQVLPTYSINVVNGSNLNILTGNSITLDVQVLDGTTLISPTPSLLFSSSNSSVFTISNGVITAVGVGNATATIKLAYDESISTTVNVTVEEVVTNNYSIEFVSPISSIYQNQTKTLTIRVLNNGTEVLGKAVTWSISDTSLATITGSTDTTCTIKGSSSGLGYVTLKATLVENINVFKDQNILVKSIV